MSDEEVQVRTVKGTRWKNPTSVDQRFTLAISGVRMTTSGRVIPRETREVVIPAGGSIVIESAYDDAIQRVRNGQVQSGLCPLLRRMKDGEEIAIPPHPALVESASAPVAVDPGSREARVRAKRNQV